MLVNNTFSDGITAKIVDANTVSVEGVQTPPRGYNNGMRPEDDIPHRHWKGTIRLKEQVDPSLPPVPHDCNGLGGISLTLAPQGLKNASVPLQRSQARIGDWLVPRTPASDNK